MIIQFLYISAAHNDERVLEKAITDIYTLFDGLTCKSLRVFLPLYGKMAQ